MDSYQDVLTQFKAIHLEDMGAVKLMNRTDDKYLFHIDKLKDVLNSALESYHALEINSQRVMGYDSLYFDTPDHRMYLLHHNRKLNRYKIRIRQYLDSKEHFLEVKFKNNKGRTQKKRIPVQGNNSLTEPESAAFVKDMSPYTVDQVAPTLSTSFERITLVNPEGKERITIDMNLTLHNASKKITIPYLVIAEVKHEKASSNEGFGKLLMSHRIFQKRISKYCLGTNLLYPEIKYNRFKPKVLFLKKLDKTSQYDQLYSAII